MNIEEAIDILKNSVTDYVIGEYCEKCADNKICDERNEDCYYQQAIDTVITAYEKEKAKVERIKDKLTHLKILAKIENKDIDRIKELEILLKEE